jgi:hypothetical protein
MENAKRFLKENPTESMTAAARIFNINENTLVASVRRGSGEKKGGHNKVLQDHEISALDDFIRSLLKHAIPPTSAVVFSAIVGLKRAHNCKAPTKRWFRGWWKQGHLHKIKTKPLPIIRFEAGHEEAVLE